MIKQVSRFFDKLEDHIRISLSHYPIVYSIIGAVGIVLFWRGIWMFADEIELSSISSFIASMVILLSTGLFVSFFVGDSIILTGLRREKKLIEKSEGELAQESEDIARLTKKIDNLEKLIKQQLVHHGRTQQMDSNKKEEGSRGSETI